MGLSNRELALLFEHGRDGVLVLQGGRLVGANPAVRDRLGFSLQQLLRLPALDALVEPEDRPDLARLLGELAAGRQPPPLRLVFVGRAGDRHPAELRGFADGDRTLLLVQRPRGGEDVGVDSLRRGATPRDRTRELEESRNRYRTLVENLADGLVTLNERGEFLFVNRTFAQMLGYRARSRLVAVPFLDCVAEGDAERVRRGLKRWHRGDVARFQANLRHSGGAEVPVLLSGRALPPDDQGRSRGVLLLVTDFAERQALTERLAQARQMDALASLAGGIAHDFNNLLTGILGNASRIRIESPSATVDELARAVEDSAELAARLTQRLMALVRGQAPHRRLLDVADIAEHTLGLVGQVLPDSIEVVKRLSRDIPPVLADESQLQQAILNLCINARDAMVEAHGGGTLTIEVAAGRLIKPLDDGATIDEPAVQLRVSDTGPGIPKELRARVFDPFFTTKGLGRGIGLGLATVYQLLDAHGGTIEVGDAPGGGATMTILLPARPGRAAQGHSQPSRTLTSAEIPRPTSTILLAEDEQAIRDLVGSALRGRGFQVLAAADGAEAAELWKAHRQEISLLFLDVRMPHLTGPDVLRLARADRPEVPAIFSSGFIPEEHEEQERFDRVLFLPKPYRIPDLLEALRRGLKLGERSASIDTGGRAGETTDHTPAFRVDSTLDPGATLIDEPAVTPLEIDSLLEDV
jgi:two-component system cell cycle sensor histidine kinase/response regulator CckA